MIASVRTFAGAIALSFVTFLAACGEDSPGSAIDAQQTADSPNNGADAPVDAAIDAGSPDMGFSGACTTATCFALDPGPAGGVPITTHAKTVDAPTLTGTGGTSLDGDYTLTAVDVYTKGTFNDAVVSGADITDNGESNGTARFADDLWGYFLNFDIHYNIQTIVGAQVGDAVKTLRGGGCFTVSGASLTTETGRCDEGWPDGVVPPSAYQVSFDSGTGVAKVKISLSKEFVISLLPPENQNLGSLAITGPLVFVLTFQLNT